MSSPTPLFGNWSFPTAIRVCAGCIDGLADVPKIRKMYEAAMAGRL